MKTFRRILYSRATKFSAIALYSLLYLCITFHFHPINFNIGASNYSISSDTKKSLAVKSIAHCEICHISSTFHPSTFSQPESANYFNSEIFLPALQINISLAHQYTSVQLRAPPKA